MSAKGAGPESIFFYGLAASWPKHVAAIAAIGAPVWPLLTVYLSVLVTGDVPPIPDVSRINTMHWVIVTVGWLLLIIANVPKSCQYLHRYHVTQKGVTKILGYMSTFVPWSEVLRVELYLYTPSVFRKEAFKQDLRLCFLQTKWTISQEIQCFEKLKAELTKKCLQFGIDMYVVDARVETMERLRKSNPDQYRQVPASGLAHKTNSLI
jgi:hypothetical protein